MNDVRKFRPLDDWQRSEIKSISKEFATYLLRDMMKLTGRRTKEHIGVLAVAVEQLIEQCDRISYTCGYDDAMKVLVGRVTEGEKVDA